MSKSRCEIWFLKIESTEFFSSNRYPGIIKSKIDQRSRRLFSIGVPVKASLWLAFNCFTFLVFNASMFLQLSAYTHLIEEYSSYKVEQVAILILNYKNPKFKFKILSKEEIEPYFGVFNDLQKLFGKVYSLDKINKEKKINTIL